MEAIAKAKQIGGSIGFLIPKEVVDSERIHVDDTLKVRIEKTDNLNSLWGKYRHIKKPTWKIMKEIDEGEDG